MKTAIVGVLQWAKKPKETRITLCEKIMRVYLGFLPTVYVVETEIFRELCCISCADASNGKTIILSLGEMIN